MPFTSYLLTFGCSSTTHRPGWRVQHGRRRPLHDRLRSATRLQQRPSRALPPGQRICIQLDPSFRRRSRRTYPCARDRSAHWRALLRRLRRSRFHRLREGHVSRRVGRHAVQHCRLRFVRRQHAQEDFAPQLRFLLPRRRGCSPFDHHHAERPVWTKWHNFSLVDAVHQLGHWFDLCWFVVRDSVGQSHWRAWLDGLLWQFRHAQRCRGGVDQAQLKGGHDVRL